MPLGAPSANAPLLPPAGETLMKRSTDRILTTHAGSLPRPADLIAMGEATRDGEPVDAAAYEARLAQAVDIVVREQVERGIDIVGDGEFGKPGFVAYVSERLSGFEVDPKRSGRNPWAGSREVLSFPDYYAETAAAESYPVRMVCTGPIAYRGHARLERDIANFRAALGAVTVEEAFMPAVSPATVAAWHRNAHYESSLHYLFAIADALHEEYQAIVDAGFLLQIDDPGLFTYWRLNPEAWVSHPVCWSRIHIHALNHALRDIPKEKIRFHACHGINVGPRFHDTELNEFVVDELILHVHAGAFSFEAANPRHEHEWQVWGKVKLPDDAVLIPGVISNSTVLVEHPELVAQRICRFAEMVGRENVIAGSDCGFANFASSREIHPSIVWAKLQALADGARIATKKLFSSPPPRGRLPRRGAGRERPPPRRTRAAPPRSPSSARI
jgi:5-methyltetrahydropteroyltriglutamate--homocysteine methyltransferase